MAILPTNFLNNLMTRPDTAANQNVQAAALAVSDANKMAVLDLINSLSPGDTLVGKVLYADNENLSLQTREGLILNAKNGSEIPLTKGESVAFEVERSNRRSVTLRPLFQNTAKDQTTVIALRQAGIPVNGRSVEMTVRNMQYGLNVDRDSLSASFKDVSLYSEAPVKNIVDLQRMGIEVNELTLKQYESYLNSENLISDALSSISSNISDALSDEVLALLPDLKEINEEALNEALETLENQDETNAEENLLERLNASYLKNARMNYPQDSLLNTIEKFSNKLSDMPSFAEVNVSEGELEILKDSIKSLNLTTDNLDKIEINDNSTTPSKALAAFLSDIKANVENLSNAANLIDDSTDAARMFNSQLQGFESLLKSAVIDNLVKRTFMSQWSLNKEKIADKAEIKDLYGRLFEQTRDLTAMLQNSGINNESITTPVNNLAENIQFMDAMNQFVPYVQIPFHNSDNNNASELYVFTNKKHMAEKGGEITAFIHLDMNNIGPTDVFVKLSDNEHITTKFTLRDDDVLSFVGAHMDILSKRLREKGYSFNAEMVKMDDFKSSIEKTLDNTTQKLMIANTSFDARV